MWLEAGDSPAFSSEPVIVTLCLYEDGYYWPGVGAEFESSPQMLKAAKTLSIDFGTYNSLPSDCSE